MMTAAAPPVFATLRLEILREGPDVVGSRRLAELCQEWGLAGSAQEAFWVVSYDAVRNIRSVCEVARGSWNEVSVSVAAVMAAVLVAGTDRFMVAHNHPPGTPMPTEADVALTEQLQLAARVLGLYFEDHVIVTPSGTWLSMVQTGFMPASTFFSNSVATPTAKRPSKRRRTSTPRTPR
jgi:DNA repair protein RadC